MPQLVFEKHFIRKANKLIKNSPAIDEKLSEVLKLLQNDPFSTVLKTHSLTGRHQNKYACSLIYSLRIAFRLYDDIVRISLTSAVMTRFIEDKKSAEILCKLDFLQKA